MPVVIPSCEVSHILEVLRATRRISLPAPLLRMGVILGRGVIRDSGNAVVITGETVWGTTRLVTEWLTLVVAPIEAVTVTGTGADWSITWVVGDGPIVLIVPLSVPPSELLP